MGASFQHGDGGPNCRQIYEHVQGCPVCQQIFMGSGAKQQRPPAELRSVMGDAIEISPTVAFLVVVLIVLLLVYMIRNLSRN